MERLIRTGFYVAFRPFKTIRHLHALRFYRKAIRIFRLALQCTAQPCTFALVCREYQVMKKRSGTVRLLRLQGGKAWRQIMI